MMTAVLTDCVLPLYTGHIIDAVSQHDVSDMSLAASFAWKAFLGYVALGFLYHCFRISAVFTWNKFAVRNLYAIVTDGMRKVQRFSSDWHANSFAGATVRKITRGMWSFDTFEDTLLLNLLPAVTMMVGVTVMLSIKLPLVGAAVAVMITLYCTLSIWMSLKILSPRFKKSADHDTKLGATLADIITGNPTVKSFGTEKREDALFEGVANEWYRFAIHAWQTATVADAVRGFFRLTMSTTMIALSIWLWSHGRASPGDIVLVITTFFMINGYLRDIGMHISHLQRASNEMEDAVSFWMRTDDVADLPDAKPLQLKTEKRRKIISFENVGFQYTPFMPKVYEGLSIDIALGEKLALVGPSGSGKSTFVKLLQRLYNVTEGKILIDGQDISTVTLESLRKAIALVPQDPVLFHRSLAENIAYGKPDATMEEIVSAAKKAFAHEFISLLPEGYKTLVGERGVKLSGGERQRVAIARAILADAPILILDEATSSLDSISEHYIQKALAVLMEGRTTITIAHRLSTIQQADRILVFDHGKIVEQGDHRALMTREDSHYKKLYDMQVLGLMADEEETPITAKASGL